MAIRQKMFRDFCKLQDYNEQQSFLRGFIKPALVNRRRHGTYDDSRESRRQRSFKYFLPLPGNSEAQVCKITFCETFGITQKRVTVLCKKILSGDLSVQDKRGGKRPQRNQLWKQKIIEFIASIPSRESHYGREKHPNKRYLSSDLNMSKLYTAFLEKHGFAMQEKPPISRQWFNAIFNKEFNLSFAPPRVDTCSTCDAYKISISTSKTPQEKRLEEMKRELHHRKAEAAQKLMAQTAKDSQEPHSDTCVISYDLQKQVYLPTLTHSQMYYSRQYTCMNFGIHLEDEGRGFMYLWEETAGRRGCNEIATCLYTFITTELQTEKRKLMFWSDNCGGQNKNQGLLAMYITLVGKGYVDEILHAFPQCGHTFLSCDRDFGTIEKALKGQVVEVPMDVIRFMANARKQKPFVITHTKNFFNWMEIAQTALTTKHLGISQVTMLKIGKKNLGQVEVTTGYSELAPWRTVNIFKKGFNQQYFETLIVEPTQQAMQPWKKDKLKQIKDMVPYISPENQDFYKTIIAQQEALPDG